MARFDRWISMLSAAGSPALLERACRFGLTTGLSAILSFGLPVALVEIAGLPTRHAVLVGFVCAYIVNVLVLRSYVYQSPNHWGRDIVAHMIINATMRLVEYGAFLILAANLGMAYTAALLIVLASSTIIKFFVYGLVFR